jgi:hypothetical protein
MLMNGLKGQLRGYRGIWCYRVQGRLLVWKEGRMGEGVALYMRGVVVVVVVVVTEINF